MDAQRPEAVIALYPLGKPDALAKHYAAEQERLKGAAVVVPDLKLAPRLPGWWPERPQRPQWHLAPKLSSVD